jgi:hypothetical protein
MGTRVVGGEAFPEIEIAGRRVGCEHLPLVAADVQLAWSDIV